MRSIALIALTLLAVVSVFQLALALGAPWGSASWGGRHAGVLPQRLRWASALAGLVVYPWIIFLVAEVADVVDFDVVDKEVGVVILWALTVLFALGALANLVSPSRVERLWAPVAGGIAVCCGFLASGL